jgi:hypothetical protein
MRRRDRGMTGTAMDPGWVTTTPAGGMLGGMTKPGSESSADLTALFDAVGITVTEEGKQRARARRRAAEARWTPERWAELRAQLGLPPRAS